MPDVFASLSRLLDWRSILDVALVTVVIYTALRLFRGTQAVQLLRGVLIVAIFIALLSLVADLPAFNWLLRNSVPMVLVAIPVIFAKTRSVPTAGGRETSRNWPACCRAA